MKKQFAVLVVLTIIAMALPILANAESSGACGDSLTWTLDDNGVLTISGTGKMFDYNYVPEDDHPITEAPWGAAPTQVMIGNGVTSIGENAFCGCGSLTEASIPNTVTSIGKGAFSYSGLTDITIPNSVVIIEDDAFSAFNTELTIRCYSGSVIQQYAEANGIKIELLDSMPRPVITEQPSGKTAADGETVAFTITASNAETYQWYCRASSADGWTAVEKNGNSSTYELTASARHNGYQYRCVVKNAVGAVYSKTAILTITEKNLPIITGQPTDSEVVAGSEVTFTVTASDADSYQWYYQKPGETTWNQVKKNGASATYTLTTAARHNGYKYQCKVQNAEGSVYSSIVVLTVK